MHLNIKRMKIGVRLSISFAMVLVLLIVTILLGISRLSRVQKSIDEITSVNNVKIMLSTAMRETVFERMIALRTAALVGSAAEMQLEVDRIAGERLKYRGLEQRLERMFSGSSGTSTQEKFLLGEIKIQEILAEPLIDRAMQLSLTAQSDLLYTLLTKELIPAQKNWMGMLGALITLEDRQSIQAGESARISYESARAWMSGIGFFAVAIGILIALLLTRQLMRQLGGEPDYAIEIVEKIAAGDLSADIRIRPGDRSSLLFAMKTMRDQLAVIVGEVRTDTNFIALISREIAEGNLDLSSRTETQAASVEATASAMDQLTFAMKTNANNAQEANQLAVSASEVARKGGVAVSEVVDTMELIKASAKKIAEIIGVIDSIAFQTNILALNAAVEAARAQDHGRGFAVVAAEVRSLAHRSAEAAMQIKKLIGDSVKNVEAGSKLVDGAGDTMKNIVESVERVMSIMNEIFVASNAQSDGIASSNRSILQIDETTQQNVALVEQAAAATENLQEHAARVSETMSVFKLDGDTARKSTLPMR